jgi:Transposase DDE domain group 1
MVRYARWVNRRLFAHFEVVAGFSPDISHADAPFSSMRGSRARFTRLFCLPDDGADIDRVLAASCPSLGFGWGNIFSDQVQFASVQQLPLDLLSRFQPDGRSQGNGKVDFDDLGSRRVQADFSGGHLSSDGGALLLRQIDRGLGVSCGLAQCFRDARHPVFVAHSVEELLGQRLHGLALGYEDLNDHDTFRLDPLLAVAAGKKDPLGRDRLQDPSCALAAPSTRNGLEICCLACRKGGPSAPITAGIVISPCLWCAGRGCSGRSCAPGSPIPRKMGWRP